MIPTAGIGAPLGDLELVAAAADTAIEDPGAADASQSTNSTLKHNNKAAAAAGVTLRTPSLMAWLTGGGAENGGVVLDPQSALRLAPVFLTWPDYHKTSTINDTLRVLWPFLKPSLEQQLRETAEAALRAKAAAGGEAAPNGGAAAYIKSLLLPKLDELRLETLDLGSEPPALHGIKVYPSEGDDVVIETCLVWSGGRGQTVTASATAALLNGGLRLYVPLTVRNLQLRAQARLMARRIDANTPPFVGTASASFLDQPELEFELPIGR